MKPLREHTISEIIGGGGIILGMGVILLCIIFGVDPNNWKIDWQPYPLYPQRIGQVSYSETSNQHQASFTSASSIDETFAWYAQSFATHLVVAQPEIENSQIKQTTYSLCTGMVITIHGTIKTREVKVLMRKNFRMYQKPPCKQKSGYDR